MWSKVRRHCTAGCTASGMRSQTAGITLGYLYPCCIHGVLTPTYLHQGINATVASLYADTESSTVASSLLSPCLDFPCFSASCTLLLPYVANISLTLPYLAPPLVRIASSVPAFHCWLNSVRYLVPGHLGVYCYH